MHMYRIDYVTEYGKFRTTVFANSPTEAADKLMAQFNYENELTEITLVTRIDHVSWWFKNHIGD